MTNLITRRQALIASIRIASLVVPTPLLFACGKAGVAQPTPPTVDLNQPQTALDTRLRQELLDASKAASAGGQWTHLEYNNSIDALGEDSLKRLCKTVSVSPTSVEQYISNPLMKKEIKNTIWSATSGILNRDPDQVLYHEKVVVPTMDGSAEKHERSNLTHNSAAFPSLQDKRTARSEPSVLAQGSVTKRGIDKGRSWWGVRFVA